MPPLALDPYGNGWLPQPPPTPHHWRLRNLRAASQRVAAARGFASGAEYLAMEPAPLEGTDRELALFSLAACLLGNVWLLSPAERPAAPAVHVLDLDLTLQSVPAAACFFLRPDGLGVLYFRGTTTIRESFTDLSTAWSGLTPDGFVTSFSRAYERQDRLGRSRAGFARACARKVAEAGRGLERKGALLIIGHSLGGAFAQLAAAQLSSSADVSVVTVAGAQGSSGSFCRDLRRRCRRTLSVVNLEDYVPFLHSLRAPTEICPPLLVLDALARPGMRRRMQTHDPAYYAAALFAGR